MIALQISDVKSFMAKLLTQTTFDRFLLSEAIITTFNTFIIEGKLNKEFYTEEELNNSGMENQHYSYWETIKPICLDLIKGRKTPLSFKYIFFLAPENVEKLLIQTGIAFSPESVNGLFLNIRFNGTILSCITGTSLNTFTLDKSLEHAWDNMIKKFFTQQEIGFEVI